jgi:segregation and condensation protein A
LPPPEYKVQLDIFEGPLDLLLYLIRKNEVDIHDIPVETITKQYMEYLSLMRMLDLNIAGEFLVMAATLMMVKSRMLLPVEDRPELLEEEEDDPRWDLVRQLVEYKKFKDAALLLESLGQHREQVFARDCAHPGPGPNAEVTLHDVSLFDLIDAFNQALNRVREENLIQVFEDRFTVAEKIDHLMDAMRSSESVSLKVLFADMTSRGEMVCTFLALLELIKLRQIRAQQAGSFGEIVISRHPDWKAAAGLRSEKGALADE